MGIGGLEFGSGVTRFPGLVFIVGPFYPPSSLTNVTGAVGMKQQCLDSQTGLR